MKPRDRYRVEATGRTDEWHWQIRRLGDRDHPKGVIVGFYHTRAKANAIKADLEGRERPREAA